MADVDTLALAVPNVYRYRGAESRDYDKTVSVADALYGHSRITMPYTLIVIGY